ncbi:MAG: Ig-like domain-containing protein, partial [Bacteroidaceae bacterium]|nr:Ig-like domain-containing protein [Bacteroidaceae bacterium]
VAVSEVGDATYDVTLNGTDIKASFTVSVSYADVTGVTISGEVPEVIRPNDQVTLTATVEPENANGEVTWSSSDETVATVENGVVTFLKEGTVTITATSVQDPTQKATKELSCEAIHVTDVVIAEEAVEILEGNNATLHVTVNPEDAANPAVTFTSGDETIATVDANGVVTGVKFGTTTITVTSVDGGKTDTVVIVVHVKINGVTITDEVKESYLPKETLQLHATVDCSDPSQGVIWSTSNKLIATVTEDGLVRFFKDGKVVITATSELDPTKSASIELVVHTPYVAMTELQVAQGEASMVVGDELQLNWTIAPVDATDMTLKFVSNNEEVAKVDENGLITAVGPGTTTINISSKDGSLTATCEVTVVAKVTGVSLNETTKTIEEGKSFTLTATVNPENAPNKAVTWETSDASIATVSNGVVTALKAGEVTITVKTNDGNKVASCVVTVTAKPANQGDNGEGGAGVIDNVLNKLGCKGSIAATSALISLATLAGAGLALSKKRKKEDK